MVLKQDLTEDEESFSWDVAYVVLSHIDKVTPDWGMNDEKEIYEDMWIYGDMDILRYMDLGGTFRIFFSFFTWSTCLRRMTSWRLRILISFLDRPIIIIHYHHLLDNHYLSLIYFGKANYIFIEATWGSWGQKSSVTFCAGRGTPGQMFLRQLRFFKIFYKFLLVNFKLYYHFFTISEMPELEFHRAKPCRFTTIQYYVTALWHFLGI